MSVSVGVADGVGLAATVGEGVGVTAGGSSGVQAATSAHPAIVAPILTKPRTPSAKATPYFGRQHSDMTGAAATSLFQSVGCQR